MKRQGIAEPMRSFVGWCHPLDEELHPMAATRVDDEHFAIKVEQRIKAGISIYHLLIVSYVHQKFHQKPQVENFTTSIP
jgi:hypothetical protein